MMFIDDDEDCTCGAKAQIRVCHVCGLTARLTGCSHFWQPRPISADGHLDVCAECYRPGERSRQKEHAVNMCDGGYHGEDCALPARYLLVRNPGLDAEVERCCKAHANYVLYRKRVGELPDVEIYLPSGGDPLVLGLWPRKDRP